MKIDVCYDLEDVQPSRLQLQRGEKLQLEVWFHGPNWDKVYDPGLAIKFGAKEAGKYASSEPIMVYCDTFVLDESGCYKGVLQLNTTNLLNLIGEEKSVTLDAQFEFSGRDVVYKTKLLKLVVSNDIIKGDEGVPVPAPSYVTKDELGQEVKSQVDVIMSDKMDEMTSLASDAAASAEAASNSKTAAATSATDAANSESLAQKWAINPRDVPVTGSGVTAKYSSSHWATYAQQYAQTASDAATSAASSRADCELFKQFAYQQAQASANSAVVSTTQAQIAADLVAGVAGVGDQVTAAQNAAATAASKATDAANSATAADSSKKAAATSASNAKTSETNAANSAKSAADSKTACEGILAQMQGLLKNVPLLDGDNVFTGSNTFLGIKLQSAIDDTVSTLLKAESDGSFGMWSSTIGPSAPYFKFNAVNNSILISRTLFVNSPATFNSQITNNSGIYYTPSGTEVQIGAVLKTPDGARHNWVVLVNNRSELARITGRGIYEDKYESYNGSLMVSGSGTGNLILSGGVSNKMISLSQSRLEDGVNGVKDTDIATVAQAGSGGSVPENVITTDNIAEHAVTSFGGKKGAIGVGSNLSMSGNTLNASGGGGSGSVDLSNYRGNVNIADHSGYNILKYDSDSDTITIGFSSRKVHVESFDFEVQTQDHVSLSMGSGVFEIDNNSEIRMVANGLFYNDTPINPYATPLDI